MRSAGLFILLFSLLLSAKATVKPRLVITRNRAECPNTEPTFADGAQTVTIPIKRAGNLIIVEAQVDSIAGNFVLDTGAPYLVLNATYFRDMPQYGDQESNGVNGLSAGTFRTEVPNFSLGFDLSYKKVKADVTDLSAIERSKKIKILGLLGTALFSKVAITIDLFHNVLYIHKLNPKGIIAPEERIFTQPELQTTFKLMNNVIFMQGSINDKKLWFAFDTGAESNLLSYSVSGKILKTMQIINRSKIVGVGGSGYEIFYASFERLTIGNYPFFNNRILIANLDHLGKAYGYSVEAILGSDFFARGIFTINFVKKEFEMYIYKHRDKG